MEHHQRVHGVSVFTVCSETFYQIIVLATDSCHFVKAGKIEEMVNIQEDDDKMEDEELLKVAEQGVRLSPVRTVPSFFSFFSEVPVILYPI